MQKKKIMLITPCLTGGGAEKVIADLSMVLNEKFDVILVTYERTDVEYEYGGTIISLNAEGGQKGILKKIYTAIKRIYKIKKLKRKFKPIAAISAVPPTDYVNVFTKVKGCKNIIEVSTNSSIAFQKKSRRKIRKIILNLADLIVAVSRGAEKDLIENFDIDKNKVKKIYNCCNVRKIIESNYNTLNTSEKKKYIITVGSFRYPKGHWHLIKAFAYIANKINNVDLIILGDGPYKNKYVQLIKNLGIEENRVIMPGFVSNPHEYIKKSELFVFTSLYEGFGNVLIESMACGTPILSTNCNYGPYEILNSNSMKEIENLEEMEYGWMYPNFEMSDIDITNFIGEEDKILGDAIETCLSNNKKREEYRLKGQKRCLDFDINVFQREWEYFLSLL